jgi:Na+/melibiose symporter-like transporter
MIPFLLGLVFYTATFGTTVRVGAFGAALLTALIVYFVASLLQPIRSYFDRERQPDIKLSIGDLRSTVRLVLDNPSLRDIAFAAFAFGGLQSLFSGFFLLLLIDGLGYSEVEAGTAFAVASVSAIGARILWGGLGSYISPRWILAGIGLFGAVAGVLVSMLDVSWSIYEITAVAILYNITALSWHGILLSETARLAPPDQVGGVTGGVLSFTSISMMIYPAIYGMVLAATGSYGLGFVLGSVPSLLAFVVFINRSAEGTWAQVLLRQIRALFTLQGLGHSGAVLLIASLVIVLTN